MRFTVFLAAILLPTMLAGQVINHFIHPDSKWNVAKTYPAANEQNPNFVATTTTVYSFQGDTLIDNELWFKLYSSSDTLLQSDLEFRGVLREENNRVFYLDTLSQLDTLYDFSLNVGDSVWFNLYGAYPEWIQVVETDSIQLNGAYYRRLKFAEPVLQAFDELNEIWIEGIGSLHGPLFPNVPVKFSQEIPDSMWVTCTVSNNQQVWQHPDYPACYVNIVLSLDRLDALNFNLYPNPFSNEIQFMNTLNDRVHLTISNTAGQLVKQLQIVNDHETIDLSELRDGIYFFTFRGEKGVKTVKMIKQNQSKRSF